MKYTYVSIITAFDVLYNKFVYFRFISELDSYKYNILFLIFEKSKIAAHIFVRCNTSMLYKEVGDFGFRKVVTIIYNKSESGNLILVASNSLYV